MDHPLLDAPNLTAAQRAEVAALCARIATLEAELLEWRGLGQPAVLNRPDFNRTVARALAFDERYGGQCSIIYFDINGLDLLRGRQGEAIAAQASTAMGNLLAAQVRACDAIGRLAANQFGVLLVRCAVPDAERKAAVMVAMLAREFAMVGGQPFDPEVTYGVYAFGGAGRSAEDTPARAPGR